MPCAILLLADGLTLSSFAMALVEQHGVSTVLNLNNDNGNALLSSV
jgi:hypothetical protein